VPDAKFLLFEPAEFQELRVQKRTSMGNLELFNLNAAK
jgi:hypothetical protein